MARFLLISGYFSYFSVQSFSNPVDKEISVSDCSSELSIISCPTFKPTFLFDVSFIFKVSQHKFSLVKY